MPRADIVLDDREQAAEAVRQYLSAEMEAQAEEDLSISDSGFFKSNSGPEERMESAFAWMEALRP